MMKQKSLNSWLWKWHIIGGLISLPFIFLLSITGAVYLFKADFNDAYYEKVRLVNVPENGERVPVSQQFAAVKEAQTTPTTSTHSISHVYLPSSPERATRFRLHSKGHARNLVHVDPYTAEVTGVIQQHDTFMYKVRKLHGELLLNQAGEYVVELIASWSIVLILTGIYIWWPAKRFSLAGFFTIRRHKSRRVFWRDMHSVVGFWASILLLIILAGGMPWTDVFGSQLKWIQAKTDTGYPKHWRSTKGLKSQHTAGNPVLTIDEIVSIAIAKNLKGALTIKLPKEPDDVFSISNRAFWLRDQKVFHIDQYSGNIVKSYDWSEVGILMEMRQIAMRLHQGEYGLVNWIVVLIVALAFALSTAAGLVSYLLRKPQGRWGLPSVPAQFKVGKLVLVSILVLGVVFPLFGLTLVVLSVGLLAKTALSKKKAKKKGAHVLP
ncbi:MAG: PepSY-associated TM helix domain-containing protein [Arenicella sp.]